MDIRKISKELAVSPQIAAADVAAIAGAGYRSIICNRPDGEGNDQPLFHEIEEAARAAGLGAHYLPVESGKVRAYATDVFLSGPPGLGKTTLAGILANELGVGFRVTSAPAMEKPKDLAGLLTTIETGTVFFIDEIHRLRRAVEKLRFTVDAMLSGNDAEDAEQREVFDREPLATPVTTFISTVSGWLPIESQL